MHVRFLIFFHILFSLSLISCSGDEGTKENVNEVISAGGEKLNIRLERASDQSDTNLISFDEPGRLIVTATKSNGELARAVVVTFNSSLLDFNPESAAVLSDENGQAEIIVYPRAGTSGAGAVVATVEIDGKTLVIELNVETVASEGELLGTVQIELSLSSGAAEVNTIRADAPGLISIGVTDSNGDGVEAIIVNVSTELATLNPSSATVLTNSAGHASIELIAGEETGADTVYISALIAGQSVEQTLNYQVSPPLIQLGDNSGVVFQQGSLKIGSSSLSAGGTTGISVYIVNENGEAFTTPLEISFSSECTGNDLAEIDSQVTSVNGLAQATYHATGCEGLDRITVSTNFGGSQFSASSQLVVQPDTAGAIEFISAEPSQIALAQTGGQNLSTTSTITFRAVGTQGLPRPSQWVDFGLSTSVGGISLSPTAALTNSEGLASTVVSSGSIATSVRVNAVINNNPSIATQSDLLNVTTGMPDQDSMSIGLETSNPEAWSINGVTLSVTAYLADFFNNSVPDGTSVAFTTEGGMVLGACTTVGSECSVEWRSQNPRPTNGRVTLLATVLGNESFSDENGNGRFDDGDSFTDLGEAFRDDDEDGIKDSAEPYIDFDNSGSYTNADGLYNGVLCEHSSLCNSQFKSISTRASARLIMASSNAIISGLPGGTINLPASISVNVSDIHNNSMPGGTSISVSTENGEVLGESNFTVGNYELESFNFQVNIAPDDESDSGLLTITVISPAGVVTSVSQTLQD